MEKIIKFYESYKRTEQLDPEFCIAFVYNDVDDLIDDPHFAEGITSTELNEIRISFAQMTHNIFLYKSEVEFIQDSLMLKSKFKNVLVYSMAQNTQGVGRRCLIPLICEHLGFFNIGNNSYSSFLGGNKEIMHNVLKNENEYLVPETYFLRSLTEITPMIENLKRCDRKTIILKPNSESASIGVEKIQIDEIPLEQLHSKISNMLALYGIIIIQEFIEGDEIEVPVLHIEDSCMATVPIKILFPPNKSILDPNIIISEEYSFGVFDNEMGRRAMQLASLYAKKLNFSAISRFDFRLKAGKLYLIDITPNPTISSMSSTSYIIQHYFSNYIVERSNLVFSLLVIMAIKKYKLLEPAFHSSK